ncbi:MAG: hypothetical protein CUN49_06175 [Candidatus Thermofonsia Clade 1 bacterium]|jgi:hypothetical protein|uniref:Uncharacterized protein n=1 Tax=Candidatus Thermofonsia Clade 1 bacterium TaxID=2364210 RepID=A0A2M8PFG7_9CHLR|nr:MAG: hypothetical protein CUN49_06175 [Candidatus Thermofonsia Clade 1 bacterium]RMF49454.1 MAG: hypothetical protein D6749_13110 [Chloroflexota bacterium]
MATEPNEATAALPPDPPEIASLDQEAPPLAPAQTAPAPQSQVTYFYQPVRLACVRCGSTNLAHGMIVEFSGQRFDQVRFAPRRLSLKWLNSLFNLRPWRRLLKLEATACRDCGAVLLVVDPEALRRAEPTRDA